MRPENNKHAANEQPASPDATNSNASAGSKAAATATKTVKSPLKKITKWVGLGLLTPTAIITAALAVGVKVDLTPYRDDINQWLTTNMERETRIDGEMGLVLSFRPEVHLEGVHIDNIEAFNWQPMLTSGKINAKVAVLPLLKGTLAVDYLELENINLHLAKAHDGQANWILGPQDNTANSNDDSAADSSSAGEGSSLQLALTDQISASNLSVVYEDQSQGQYFDWYLDSLNLSQPDEQWEFLARGAIIGQPYDIQLTGDLEQLFNQQTGKVKAKGSFAGAELNIEADAADLVNADINLQWQDTGPIEALFGLDVKHVAPLTISTHVSAAANNIKVSDLIIDSPITHGAGYLDIELGDHNVIDGELNIPLIDLRPWLQPEPQPMMRAFSAAPQQSPLQRALEQWLEKTTTRVDLSIDEIKGLGTPVENLSLSVNGKAGVLSAPMTADIAEVPFRGQASLDATGWVSNLDIRLGAEQSPLGEMARWLTGMPYSRGHLDRAELAVTTNGTKLSEWLERAELSLAIDKALVEWGSEASFSIDQARLNAGITRPFQSDIQGQLMGIPAHVKAEAGTLQDIMMGRDWPTTLTFDSPAISVEAKGLLKHTRWEEGSWFDLKVNSEDASLLNPWLGIQTNISGTINIDGKLSYQNGWIDLAMPDLALLESYGDVTLRWQPDQQRPFLVMDAQFSQLDFTQFGQFINDEELPQVEQTVPTQGVNLDVPLLGSELVIADADLNFRADKLKWADQQLDKLSFSGKVRDGQMSKAPISASFAGSTYQGDLSLGVNAANIEANLNLAVNQPDIGAILSRFDVTDDFDMQLDRAKLAVSLSGRTILELMEHTEVDAALIGGQANIADSYTGKALAVKLDQGRFVTGPDTSTRLTINGIAAGKAASLKLSSLSLKEANDGRSTLPVTLAANLGDMRFNASSNLTLPIDPKALNLTFEAFTPNLDRLEAFSDIDLPPYGPITLTASLAMDTKGYHLNDMKVQVNDSQLNGKGAWLPPLKADQRPRLELAFRAPFIQLDDFKVGDWQAWEKESTEQEASDEQPADDTLNTALISTEGLNMLNATFSLDVDEVRSGKDWLGAGQLHWALENGVFTLKPMTVQLPGGNIELASEIKAKDDMFDIQLTGNVKNFDYGILARRLAPESGMHGNISTQFNLTSLANSPDTLMNNANGFIGFAAWPQEFESDLIDLWAVSLTDAIIPNFTNNDPSVLNCVAAGLDIRQGTMSQRDLLLDTSRIQVNGQFDASYANRDFALYLRPQSKRAQIFSLQTPVEVYGKFEDFDFSVPLSAILETSVRFTTSPVVSPLRWLVEKPIAQDGSQQCELIWQGQS
ncbi:AsmA family protein [Photobacterium rosenbergii]|uniref:AsmA family protein n=1 Tax=Photobacterium rosenbergii TaxID=294936 RepID=UPI001C999935|nr:AsmA family protein [Photobacterium rosenbergii]MBY5944521.1 AsmA family protein [Photobacterium rosenbergii]